MKIGDIAAEPGAKAFGFLLATETHGHFPVHAPIHIVAGAAPGPTLVVQGGVSGLELEAAAVLPQLVQELDPASLKGTLVVSPLFNTSGFEFEQVNAVWDDKNLNALGRGDAGGTVSEMLVNRYYSEAIAPADALLDMRSGGLAGYYCYAGVYKQGDVAASRALAAALGLPQVLVGQPDDNSMAQAAAEDGKAVASVWIGGGPGLRDYRHENNQRMRNAVLNAMRHLGMLDGPVTTDASSVTVINCHSVIMPNGPRGLTFMDKTKRGAPVAAGEVIGIVRHAHTGHTIHEITAPRAGIMLHGGTVWPVAPEDEPLAILGDLVEEIVLDGDQEKP